ncbi:RICIN domain-containing protein [Streptomyces sp. NBC_00212]|uniref:RICIN domain-containing protein n=1 Tax=Streptomyces sp. NBC_00212 TaxID=2975684 RepID=UPI00324FB9D6
MWLGIARARWPVGPRHLELEKGHLHDTRSWTTRICLGRPRARGRRGPGGCPVRHGSPLHASQLQLEQCLGILNGSSSWGAHAIQWGCNGNDDQKWSFQGAGDIYITITNSNDGECLGIDGGSTAQGARAIQWGCNGNDDQKWHMVYNGPQTGTYRFVNKKSGQCLGILNGSNAQGAEAIQWGCNGRNDQSWYL